MIRSIRKSKATKVVACYISMMLLLEIFSPMAAYALTGGPTQPEFTSFTPIGTSDMVDLASGDFSYNIPIMDVGGYPINLAYNSGVTMDQEASWVGLGWDLSIGQINRQVRGIPDDFNGDKIQYENNMADNVTVGGSIGGYATVLGLEDLPGSIGVQAGADFGVRFNNYDGFGFSVTEHAGLSYQIMDNLSIGMDLALTSSASEGVSISPSANFSRKYNGKNSSFGANIGVTYNSRKGMETISMTGSWKPFAKQMLSYGNMSNIGSTISFATTTYTPSKRIGMVSRSSFINLGVGLEMFSAEPGIKTQGYKTVQGIKETERQKSEAAYGYQNQAKASSNDILDFNREKDKMFSVYSNSLAIPVNTYDLYSVQGQGIGGMFRPYRGQVTYVSDPDMNDQSSSLALGFEIGIGGGTHLGFDASQIDSNNSSSEWSVNNGALPKFRENSAGSSPDYEKVYFKNIGGFHVDKDIDNFKIKLGGYDPIRIKLAGSDLSASASSSFSVKKGLSNSYFDIPVSAPIKRTSRVSRGQAIQTLTRLEAERYGFATQFSKYSGGTAQKHHTAEIRVTKDGGERYVYGRALYNIIKKEVTFNVSDNQKLTREGLVFYGGADNTRNNSRGKDHFFSGITTPPYAHTYLLTAVLSSDYSDLTNNGPTDDDLGTYTKFVYNDSKTRSAKYKWRIPLDKKPYTANYDEGLRSLKSDDKGSYTYGEKELVYIDTIVTKTHIAIFHLSPRKDGFGAKGENGGISADSPMYKLDRISLYSKPEFLAKGENATPIKEAHFVYNYSLCTGVSNNIDSAPTSNETSNKGGKLTLEKVYFTYGKSKMGRYAPYTFVYPAPPAPPAPNLPPTADNLPVAQPDNPVYNPRAFNTWGLYKPEATGPAGGTYDALTNAEYPYSEQNKETADMYARAWLLKEIRLPSGGVIVPQYESDDYSYVQDREVMQMFKVAGVGNGEAPSNEAGFSNVLYESDDSPGYVYVKVPTGIVPENANNDIATEILYNKLIRGLGDKPAYFRFLLNMAPPGEHEDRYEYVTGYMQLRKSDYNSFKINNDYYLAIPMQPIHKGDGFNADKTVNPIAKAGWQFGRQQLSSVVYTNPNDEITDDLEEIVTDIINSFAEIGRMFTSPNKQLMNKRIASRFIKDKSWIRLMNPTGVKYGGGVRVKEIRMFDNWDVMTNNRDNASYKQQYGQVYNYSSNEGRSSGVATFEPQADKENPFVEPFSENMPGQPLGTDETQYVELPMGESFYPSPKITYSRVTVVNLPRNDQGKVVKKHATGSVVTEFYTTRDFPTLNSFTDLQRIFGESDFLLGLLNIEDIEHLTLSQGFCIHTNDMDGKMKSQRVYGEGQEAPISGADYIYDSVASAANPAEVQATPGKLNNEVITIDEKGQIKKQLVGVDCDVINDFRESRSTTALFGANANVFVTPPTPLPIPAPTLLVKTNYHERQMRSAATVKVIHSCGILRETRVFDVGSSSVSTRNLAWDANTGEVLLTETVNEYNDKYYTFNYPAYWAYDGMKQAVANLQLNCKIKYHADAKFMLDPVLNAAQYLHEGDEVWIVPSEVTTTPETQYDEMEEFKAYVSSVVGNTFQLIDEDGIYITPQQISKGELTVTRSGYRNMATQSMASVVSTVNPILSPTGTLLTNLPQELYTSSAWQQYRIVNASAIEYNDQWAAPCECKLPNVNSQDGLIVNNYNSDRLNKRVAYNPYKYNVKGMWRPNKSYAYLTSRKASTSPDPRNDGFFNDFTPYYKQTIDKKWVKVSSDKWKYASEITLYNPYGSENENKDALGRYSSALYGYNYRFPVAVASNAKYNEVGYDGFEDYDLDKCGEKAHMNFREGLSGQQVLVTGKQSHSGTKSIRVAPGNTAVLKRRVATCTTATQQNGQ